MSSNSQDASGGVRSDGDLALLSDRLDHHMLLPTEHPAIRVTPSKSEVLVTYEDRRWIFPLDDCILLPVANTTTELIARYIGRELLAALDERGHPPPPQLSIGVDENQGQWGTWHWKR